MRLTQWNAWIANEDGRKPVNMQRVEELTGKSLQFYNESLNDVAALQNIFKRVNLLKSNSILSVLRVAQMSHHPDAI